MTTRWKLLALAVAGTLCCVPIASGDPAYEGWLLRVGDYETLARAWRPEAMFDNAEKQERLAELFLGPHAAQAKARPYEGIHFLFRAAVNGRPTAMRRLGEGVNKGSFGLARRPDAARCWLSAPASFEGRLACVSLTGFDDPKARVPCVDLAVMEAMDHPENRDGAAMARLCLANNTPAFLTPGPPPGPQDKARANAYARHGIEWVITGDVYNKQFETFREKFNRTTAESLEARHGRGYLDGLSKEISAGLSRK